MAPMQETNIQVRRRAVLAAAAAALALSGATAARADPDLVGLNVVDRDTGRIMPVWRHGGRLYVVGEPGDRYSLRISNRTAGRVLVVMSVDGINIVTGETAGYGQSGYVLDPFESYDVSGWRKSDSEVAAFSFAPLPQSYAARTGRPGDVGVIGMAVFRERALLRPLGAAPRPLPIAPRAAPPAPLAAPALPPAALDEATVTGSRIPRRDSGAPAPEEKLGSAHGAREWSAATRVAFVRATTYPACIRQIEYDTYANLLAKGVIPRGRDQDRRPRAFPAAPEGGGYVPDPPDMR